MNSKTAFPLEKQVCSIRFAQRLQKLGLKQESVHWWNRTRRSRSWWLEDRQSHLAFTVVSAFTATELGALIPPVMTSFYKTKDWHADYDHKTFSANTEADCRAKMLIYLLENKLVTV
jgi:hypothetical protein